eukprot:TRINITY_DN3122_c0_g1_i1.p1 TRINITY_DN3122_c0_g1~~TRINITY_DN3122_c0_g1_i1.p1  ORF type:complete len:419 (+),score=130.30 TRINITY_DN3122_c0_g1_i1:55-1311(+)
MASKKGAAAKVVKEVAKKVATKPQSQPVNKRYIRNVEQSLLWPKHISYLFLDASPMVYQLPYTRRIRMVHKLRSRAEELLTCLAFDFHHKIESLNTTTMVWDHMKELEQEDGAFGVDFRLVNARPEFVDANQLMTQQAKVDPELAKASLFVTPHGLTASALRSLGAVTLTPLHWMEHVIRAHAQSGSVDIMQFLRDFARRNSTTLGLPPSAEGTDPYGPLRPPKGLQWDAGYNGMRSADFFDRNITRVESSEPTNELDLHPVLLARRLQLQKQKLRLNERLSQVQQELKAESAFHVHDDVISPRAPEFAVLPVGLKTSPEGEASDPVTQNEIDLYFKTVTETSDAQLRGVLRADEILGYVRSGVINRETLVVKETEAGSVLQSSLDRFFLHRLHQRDPSLAQLGEQLLVRAEAAQGQQ